MSRWYPPTTLHGVITQKTTIWNKSTSVFTASSWECWRQQQSLHLSFMPSFGVFTQVIECCSYTFMRACWRVMPSNFLLHNGNRYFTETSTGTFLEFSYSNWRFETFML
jgi:hypothetical protein